MEYSYPIQTSIKLKKANFANNTRVPQLPKTVLLYYINEMMLKQQYGRAALAIETLSHIVPQRHLYRIALLELGCIHGIRDLYRTTTSDEHYISDEKVRLHYMQLLGEFTRPETWTEILRDFLSFELQLLVENNSSRSQFEDVFNRFLSYTKEKPFYANSKLQGDYGILAFYIYSKYVEDESFVSNTSNELWLPVTAHALLFLQKDLESSLPTIAVNFLKEAIKYLRASVRINSQEDFYVEYLIRALVSLAALPNVRQHTDISEFFKFSEYWNEIKTILDSLPRGVKTSPAAARLRFHVSRDLEPYMELNEWPYLGFELFQLDPLCDWDLVYLPLLDFYSKESNKDNSTQNIWQLLVMILNRIELYSFNSSCFLWFHFSQALVKFRSISDISADDSDRFKALFEIRKHWYPTHLFCKEPNVSISSEIELRIFEGSILPNAYDELQPVELFRHRAFLKITCAKLLYQPSPNAYHYPGEISGILPEDLSILNQLSNVQNLIVSYPGLSGYFSM